LTVCLQPPKYCLELRDVCVGYLFAAVYDPTYPPNTEYEFHNECSTLYYTGFGIFCGCLGLAVVANFTYIGLHHTRQLQRDIELRRIVQQAAYQNQGFVNQEEEEVVVEEEGGDGGDDVNIQETTSPSSTRANPPTSMENLSFYPEFTRHDCHEQGARRGRPEQEEEIPLMNLGGARRKFGTTDAPPTPQPPPPPSSSCSSPPPTPKIRVRHPASCNEPSPHVFESM